MLTAVSGAVGRYYAHRKMHVDELHCLVPMSLRQSGDRHALGNRVGAFNVALPIGESDPLLRLARIQRQTGAAKSDRRGAAWPLMMQVLASMPGFAYRLLAQAVTGRVNLICTNIPGPPVPRYLAGAKIDVMYPFAPVALGTPLSIALMSYGDSYGVGVDTDPAAIPDPELLTRYLAAAVDEIEDRAVRRPIRRGAEASEAAAREGSSAVAIATCLRLAAAGHGHNYDRRLPLRSRCRHLCSSTWAGAVDSMKSTSTSTKRRGSPR